MASDESVEEFNTKLNEVSDSICWTCQRVGWECLCSMPVNPPEGAEYHTIQFKDITLYSMTACKFHWDDGSKRQDISKVVEYDTSANKAKAREAVSDRKIKRYDRLFKNGLIDQITYKLLTGKEG